MRASAIIVAAGNSRRMGFDKLFADIDGKPVLRYSIEAFQACDAIDEIIVVTPPANHRTVQGWKKKAPACKKLTAVVEGGAERRDSVHRGLQCIVAPVGREVPRFVAVHDGARPLITPGQITRCVQAAFRHRAAACARPLTETLKRGDAEGWVSGSVDRENLWVMETPQVFEYQLLMDAYARVLKEDVPVTDEVSAVELTGVRTRLVENPAPNIKITFPADLALAEGLLRARKTSR